MYGRLLFTLWMAVQVYNTTKNVPDRVKHLLRILNFLLYDVRVLNALPGKVLRPSIIQNNLPQMQYGVVPML